MGSDQNVIGLHHLALTVGADELEKLHSRLLDTKDVAIEFAPEPLSAEEGGPNVRSRADAR